MKITSNLFWGHYEWFPTVFDLCFSGRREIPWQNNRTMGQNIIYMSVAIASLICRTRDQIPFLLVLIKLPNAAYDFVFTMNSISLSWCISCALSIHQHYLETYKSQNAKHRILSKFTYKPAYIHLECVRWFISPFPWNQPYHEVLLRFHLLWFK